MVNFWKLVNKVISQSDILLLVIDSRFPEMTMNREIEEKILQKESMIYWNR